MSSGVNFKDLCVDLRGHLDRVTAERDAALGREADLVERQGELREGITKHWQVVCDQLSKIEVLQQRLTVADQPQGEPVALTAVGVLRDDGDGGLVPEWILEGGTAELWAGAMLLIAAEDQELCAEDGHCELYRVPAENPAPAAVVLPERRDMRLIKRTRYWNGQYDGWNACLKELERLNPGSKP